MTSKMRIRRTHYALAVMVVATALAADRTFAAAPELKPTTPSLARTLAARLTTQLQRSVPAVSIQPIRRPESIQTFAPQITQIAPRVYTAQQPFQFRLPPPAL